MNTRSITKVDTMRRTELYTAEPMTPRLAQFIEKAKAELSSGQVSRPFNNAEDFLADLKK